MCVLAAADKLTHCLNSVLLSTPRLVITAGQKMTSKNVSAIAPTKAAILAPRNVRSTSASSGLLSSLLAHVRFRSLEASSTFLLHI